LPVAHEKQYYFFGITDQNCWQGTAIGFDCYSSRDLKEWDGPFVAFRPPKGFWVTHNFSAPEVHFTGGTEPNQTPMGRTIFLEVQESRENGRILGRDTFSPEPELWIPMFFTPVNVIYSTSQIPAVFSRPNADQNPQAHNY